MRTGSRENVVVRLRRARRRGGLEPMRDEGAVALLVALCVSTFLLGFAALAVDFGQVYARKGDQQSLADLAALAGASKLPNPTEAAEKAFDTVCPGDADARERQEQAQNWEEGVCTSPDAMDNWTDGEPENGEFTFYEKDTDDNGVYDEIDEIEDGATEATAIRVELAESRVVFGLGQTFGADGLTVTAAATARIGSALASGMLPFAVVLADTQPGKQNRFCVKDPDATQESLNEFPGEQPPPFIILPWLKIPRAPEISIQPGSMAANATAREVTIRRSLNRAFPADTEVWYRNEAGASLPYTANGTRTQLRVQIPDDLDPDDPPQIWVTWDGKDTRSYPKTLNVPEDPLDPCSRIEALRGFGNFDRNPGIADGQAELVANIQRGLQPEVRTWPGPEDDVDLGLLTPIIIGLGLGPTVTGVQCGALNPLLGGLQLQPVTDAVLGYVNCMETPSDRGFADAMTDGLLADGAGRDTGRLTRRCSPNAPQPVLGHTQFTIDNTNLLSDGSPLVNEGVGGFGSAGDLKEAIENRAPAKPGWIRNEALGCGRMVAMPVLDVRNLLGQPTTVQPNGQYPIIDITYAWIDDGSSGLKFAGPDTLQAFRGHVVDPGYFPEVVTGSPVVGEYLGDYLPRQAVLVRDQRDVL